MKKHTNQQLSVAPHREAGAVSMFIVIFFLLLVSVITLGFVRIALQDRAQSTDNDLAQSALNSAQAGVEDAKRVLKRYNQECPNGGSSSPQCQLYENALNSPECDAIFRDGGDIDSDLGLNFTHTDGGAAVQVSGDSSFNQAYTCLDIILDTPTVPGRLTKDKSDLIPLLPVDGASFNTVRILWYSHEKDNNGQGADLASSMPVSPFVSESGWPSRRPPVVRAQLIQHPVGNFRISDVTTRTMFFYPINRVGDLSYPFSNDVDGLGSVLNPVPVSCSTGSREGSPYHCEGLLTFNSAVPSSGRVSYLRLTSIYKSTDFEVSMLNGINSVMFEGVQPIVDATGRANDVFRRVKVGVRTDVGEYAENALESSQPLCKSYVVTNRASDFNGATCAPSP